MRGGAALGLLLGLVWACSQSAPGPGPQAAAIAASQVHNQQSPYRPRLTLVEREGDPRRGLALAVYVGASPLSAAALSMLVEGRIRAGGLETVTAHPSSSGFILSILAETSEEVARFIRTANAALVTPVSAVDVERVAARWRVAPPKQASSPSEMAMAQCSGELLLPHGTDGPVAVSSELGRWLQLVGVQDVAFAVVGGAEHLETAAEALAGLSQWTRLGRAADGEVQAALVGSGPGLAGQLNLSVALWGAPPAEAMATAERLADPGSFLALRLGAGFPAWQIARITSHLSRRGSCLRVDLQATGTSPNVGALATSVSTTFDELEHTLARVKPGPWVIARQVLAMDGPHQAAAVAAWQALSVPERDGAVAATRRLVHYAGPLSPAPPAERIAQLLVTEPEPRAVGLEVKRAVEAGQGKFWMLLATPCGTRAEDTTTAGTAALAAHATALAFHSRSGVALEPWLNVDAMGILAHAAPSAPHESPAAQAERVAEAVARALLSAGPDPMAIANARDFLLDAIADGPTPTLSLALRQTSGNHPSWLEPRGTWSSLSAISTRSVQLERESFVRGKLRLVSLGNHDAGQLEAGERRLLSLLKGLDGGQRDCSPRRAAASIAGKYRIQTTSEPDADAVISVPFPPAEGLSEETLWTEWLMNRTGGWLHHALLRPGLVSTARARAFGGSGSAALVIEIHAVDGKREEAVAQVRGLLERLRAGAASPADARHAGEFLARREVQRQLNPRGRLVDLWYGRNRSTATLESLRALHRVAFEAGREVVVLADPAE